MSTTEQELKKLMANLFRCSEGELTPETGPGDINGWDSLGHVSLMTEIQNQFGKHIPVEDAIEIESIADIVDLLDNIEAES
ncbi:MAG: acyl carrier protein [Pseudomonadota bacterium]